MNSERVSNSRHPSRKQTFTDYHAGAMNAGRDAFRGYHPAIIFFASAIDDIGTCSVSSTPPLFVLQ